MVVIYEIIAWNSAIKRNEILSEVLLQTIQFLPSLYMESIGNTSESTLNAANAYVPNPFVAAVDPTPHIFYGTSQEVEGYDAINSIVATDHSGTLFMEFSMDNEVWDISFSYPYPPSGSDLGTAMYKSVPTLAKFYRSGFVNTTDLSQNTFRLQTLMHENSRQLSSDFDSISIVQSVNRVGSKGNVVNSTSLLPLTSSLVINISQYKECVISYEDISFGNTDNILIFTSIDNTTNSYVCIGKLEPFVSANGTTRYAFDTINLAPFNYLYIYNNSTTETLTGATCSIFCS